MAARVVQIEVRMDGGQYEAAITKMTEANQRFTKDAVQGATQAMAVFEKLKQNPDFMKGMMEGATDELKKYTGEIPRVIDLTEKMAKAAENAGEKQAGSALKARQALIPLVGAITLVTSAIATQNPAIAAVINTIDNLAFSVIGAVAATGSWAGAFAALLSPLGLVIAATTLLAGAIAFLSSKYRESAKEREAWERGFASLQTRAEDLAAANEKELISLRIRRDLQASMRNAQNEEERAGLRALAATVERLEIEKLEQREAEQTAEKRKQLAEQAARKAEQAARERKRLADAAARERQREVEQEERAANRFYQSTLRQNEVLAIQIITMTDGEAAVDAYRAKLLETEAATHNLTDAQREQIKHQAVLREGLRDLRIEEERRAALAKSIADAGAALDAQQVERNEGLRAELELKNKLGGFELAKLEAGGATEGDRLRKQIELLRTQREALENSGLEKVPGQIAEIINQEELAALRLEKLGEVSINVGHTIANSVGDAFEGVILGTSKLSDIGKNLFHALLRDVSQFFTNVMVKKLGFENLIFTNLRGFGGQAQGALASGLSAAGGGNTGGGFLSLLLGGGRPAGVSGPLMQNGSFLSGGGGILQSLGIGDLGQKISGFMGTSGGGQGILGGIGTFFSDIFGGNSILGSFGGPLLGGAGSLLLSAFTGGFKKSQIGSTLGQAAGAGIGSIFGPIGTLLGGVVGNFIGSLFNQTPNPTAILKAQFSGIFFDSLESVFKPGTVSVSTLRTKDIGSGRAGQIKTQVQQALETASQEWTDILNLFPKIAQDRMIPTLAATNENLNNAFGRLKFSEGGKRSIEQELADFQGRESARGFFHAMRSTIGTGFQATLEQLGLPDVGQLAFEQFNRGVLHRGNKPEGGVFMFPDQTNESAAAALKAIADAAGLTAGLANVSPRGVQPFLTSADNEFLRRELTTLFTGSSGDAFTKNATALKEKLKPVTDFLQQAVGESTTVFGRGIVAALDAATQSDAKKAFMQSLGDGTKEIIFKGITEAFIASAQFNDLLAPIQQTIRGFTQTAIATGQTPDLNAFRQALLPQIEALSARGEILAPLLLELQKLGLTFNDALKAFAGKTTRGTTNIKIDILAGNKDVSELASELDDHLRALLGPS